MFELDSCERLPHKQERVFFKMKLFQFEDECLWRDRFRSTGALSSSSKLKVVVRAHNRSCVLLFHDLE